ncbi:uncharacterized protein LOC126661668 [Mercurialis annua]|uniref:uncharacterized protein LOC126661668 n=1 Tax=Mercurialis annua TaxID=3986 RepID=UPI0021609D1D|nr:uncharacterized protein LOC126661668 [Mercurialis annua]
MGNPRTFKDLNDHVRMIKPCLVFLMETKMVVSKLESIKYKLNMEGCFGVSCEGKSGGLALFWDSSVSISIKSYSSFHIDCFVEDVNQLQWRFTGFYGNPTQSQRIHSWMLLKRLKDLFSGPWVCGGDFNEILDASEKDGGNPRPEYLIRNFKESLEYCELFDTNVSEKGFSWWCKRASGVIRERLDRFVINLGWQTLYPNFGAHLLDFGNSDHRPILLYGQKKRNFRNRRRGSRFHLEEVWTTHAEFKDKVAEVWNSGDRVMSMEEIPRKLNFCAKELGHWGRLKFGNLQKRIAEKKGTLKNILNASNGCVSLEQVKSVELEIEELASKRRAANRIEGLQDENGNWKEEPNEIQEIIQSYFANLFESSNPSDQEIQKVTQHVEASITNEMNEKLIRSFTAEEVINAIRDTPATKAPGRDGFPALFFQKYWDIVGEDVVKVCLNILNDDGDLRCINQTVIALIPKVKKAARMTQFRPISLCNVIYKFMSKVLANRFKNTLDRVIDVAQSAFIPDRQIIDNGLIGFECIHVIKKSVRKKNGHAAIKLDMAKAYDKVEWRFLKAMMERMGYCRGWIKKIMNCLNSVQFSFLVEGQVKGNINPERGLRQGDPLSPYLFLICAQGLSSLLNSAIDNDLIRGLKFGDNCVVSHLFFADDSLIFTRANVNDCAVIRDILQVYSKASGQTINLDKSAICFGKGADVRLQNEISQILQIPITECHEKYLGLPSSVGRSKSQSFKSIKERIWNKLQSWKGSLFSSGGKEVLLKAVIQAIPSYYMNCFKFPKSLIREIERLCCRFWWGSEDGNNKIHWARWKTLCEPKCLGGLGFKDLECFNKSLLAKQGWRIFKKPDCVLAKILKHRYFKDGSFLTAGCPNSASYTWKSIWWGREILMEGLRWRVGDGKSIYIYRDKWLNREKTFRVISNPVLAEDAVVGDLFLCQGQWNLELLKASFVPDDVQCNYSVRSGYRVAFDARVCGSGSDSTGVRRWWKFLWCLAIPSKIKIFIWRCFQNWLPVRLNLINRGMCITHICPVCNKDRESAIHCLWFCKNAKSVWKEWNCYDNFEVRENWSIQDLIFYGFQILEKSDFIVFGVVLWLIWNNRNGVVFGRNCKPAALVIDWALSYIEEFNSAKVHCANIVLPHRFAVGDCIWVPPKPGTFTVNVDASFDVGNGRFSTGVVIRDTLGKVRATANRRYEQQMDVSSGEACAIRDGISLAMEANLIPFQILSDSKVTIDTFNSKNSPCNELSLIAEDCRRMIPMNSCIGFSYVNRKANRAADIMARLAFKAIDSFSVWLGCVPSEIKDCVLADSSAVNS